MEKVKGALGYQYKVVVGNTTTTKLIKKPSFSYKLKLNKKYKFSIRAYKKFNGKKVYGKWSTKKIRIKLL